MAEWFKAAVLKTVERKFRGFESYSLRHNLMQDFRLTLLSFRFSGFIIEPKNEIEYLGEMAE